MANKAKDHKPEPETDPPFIPNVEAALRDDKEADPLRLYLDLYADTLHSVFGQEDSSKAIDDLRTKPIEKLREEFLTFAHRPVLAKDQTKESELLLLGLYSVVLFFRGREKLAPLPKPPVYKPPVNPTPSTVVSGVATPSTTPPIAPSAPINPQLPPPSDPQKGVGKATTPTLGNLVEDLMTTK